MRASEPAAKKYKKVCDNFPNLTILTKRSIPGEVQLTFTRETVGNKPLGESVVVFALAGNLDSSSVVSINTEINFASEGNKICLPITEVLLRAAAGNLAHSKNQRGMDATQWRSLPAIPHRGRNTQQGVGRGRSPENFRLLRHGESGGGGRRRRRRRQRRQQR